MADEKLTQPEEEETITLTDKEGQEHEFRVLQILKVNEQDYVALLPIESSLELPVDVLLLRIEEEDGEEVLVEIESDEEFEQVWDAWAEAMDAEEDEESDEALAAGPNH